VRVAGTLAVVLAVPPAAALAQRLPPAPARPAAPAAVFDLPAARPLIERPWVRPVASLLVPGSGQLLARQPRGALYLAAEVWVLAQALSSHARAEERARRFRDLAYDVARRPYATVRIEGPFEYYETMAAWVESGRYDTDPGPGIAPETDETTFNGSVWRLARTTFFEDPDAPPPPESPAFQAALRFYASRAVTDPFRWSWRNARLEQDVFRRAIRSSDDAYQEATNWLGALVLNHLASAVDAFISARLLARNRTMPILRFRTAPSAMMASWTLPL
jgi:hypothetical protein